MAEAGDGAGAVRPGAVDAAPRDELFDLAAHDIKNALNVVNSALDLMAEDPAEVADMLPLLRRSSGRIGRLVATLVEVNRLVGGTMPVQLEATPWGALCDAAVAEVALIAQAKGITIDRRGDDALRVRCDQALLGRVLTNLLDHALAASPRNAVVDLHAAAEGAGLRALVANRGAALSPDLVPTLLDGDDALRSLGGWGLGIVFCRLAMRRHGGTIRVVSPYEAGQGLAFEIGLP
jgi:signal transduction histidine kinase